MIDLLDMVSLLFQVPNPRVGGNSVLDNPHAASGPIVGPT